ncbi:MAG: hypothetical protein ACE5HP_10360, partial [Gemmatimonadota bacterium]
MAAAVAQNPRGPLVLAGLVLLLGLISVLLARTGSVGEEAMVREGRIGLGQAMQDAQEPTWITLLNPIVGAVGVVLGGRLRLKESRSGECRPDR